MFNYKITKEINDFLLQNYDQFSEVGLFDYIEKLNHEIVNKNDLLNEALEIFNKSSVDSLISYVTQKLLSKFVLETLTFVIQDEYNSNVGIMFTHSNNQLSNKSKILENFGVYKNFFNLSPASITYDAFKIMLDDPKYNSVFDYLSPKLLVPMMGIDGTYGFIIFGKKIIDGEFESEEIEYIDQLMKYVSVSLQNIINYNKATMDLKTKLYNHDFFIQRLSQEIQRVKRYNSEFSILMLDIDFFKKINDTYGHIIGDKILKLLAKTIKDNIREEDVAARFGGEEFIIMLIECKKEFGYQVAERIRKKIENYILKLDDINIKITVSIGVFHVDSLSINPPNEIIEKADKALYYSKQNGRNRTTLWTEDL